MSVIIEELETEVVPPTLERRSDKREEIKVPDERKVLEALAYQQWLQTRLIAD